MRLWIVGGFLGAGKTTAIAALARLLTAEGLRVAAVTNDQGSDLVDTRFLADQGIDVVEVPGGCFCCNFDELARGIARLDREEKPDVILAEPVGSCTDLVATLFRPARGGLLGSDIVPGPLTVLADPTRVRRCLLRPQDSRFPNQVNELFRHQLAEADIIALNRCDTLAETEAEALRGALAQAFPGAHVLGLSARVGTGVDALCDMLRAGLPGDRVLTDIDYGRYAQAEAALGWLNASARLAGGPADMNAFLRRLAEAVVAGVSGEVAHLKLYAVPPARGSAGAGEADYAKLSLIARDAPPEMAREMAALAREAHLVANIRMCTRPGDLREGYQRALIETTAEYGLAATDQALACFAPAPPKPRHRMLSTV